MISPEFETELVKEVLGQPADLSRQPPWRRSVVRLRDLESVEILASTTEHTVALHERFAKPDPCRDKNKAVVDVETLAHRPQGVTGGGKLAI